jgi:hypothetical protein
MTRVLPILVGLQGLAGLSAAFAPAAHAAPVELVDEHAHFWLFDDVDGSIENANWFQREPFFSAYGDVESGFLAVHPDDSQFLVVFTTWKLPAGVGALYQSVANDVQGIGYEHIADLDPVIPAPYFDDTPNSQVQGFLHMNDWTQYLGEQRGRLDDTRISLIFGQEFGHAWLAFPFWRDEGGNLRDDLLGRSDAHWSFYLDSSGSPVEGHDWVDNGDGTFTALKQEIFQFSQLDLYLMGLLPPEDVEPFFLLEDVHDCVDSALENGECAPHDGFQFEAESYTVSATRTDITIDQVIAAEGQRVPAFGDAPTSWDVSFLLIKRSGEVLSNTELAYMNSIVERSIDIFVEQTGGRGAIVNRTATGDPVEPDPPGSDTGGEPGTGDDTGSPNATSGSGDGGVDGPGPTSGAGASTGSDTDGAGAGGSDDAAGCGCHSGSPAPLGALAGFLGLFALGRRSARTRRAFHGANVTPPRST